MGEGARTPFPFSLHLFRPALPELKWQKLLGIFLQIYIAYHLHSHSSFEQKQKSDLSCQEASVL